MSSAVQMIKRGFVSGKGAEFKVVLGFKPSHVKVYNVDDNILGEKFEQMAGLFARKVVAAGTQTFADDMIKIESDGFTIGSDADLNASGETLHYVAFDSRNE